MLRVLGNRTRSDFPSSITPNLVTVPPPGLSTGPALSSGPSFALPALEVALNDAESRAQQWRQSQRFIYSYPKRTNLYAYWMKMKQPPVVGPLSVLGSGRVDPFSLKCKTLRSRFNDLTDYC
jgi:hypothetical protein